MVSNVQPVFSSDMECFGESSMQQQVSHQISMERDSKFVKKIRLHSIPSLQDRILCDFLYIYDINNLKNDQFKDYPPLIDMLTMLHLNDFMAMKGYVKKGECHFSNDGRIIPTENTSWTIKDKVHSFISNGCMFYELEKDKKNRVAFQVAADLHYSQSFINCWSKDVDFSQKMCTELEDFVKKNNCLQNQILKNVNLYSADFTVETLSKDYNWDNYYYDDDIKNNLQIEVFNFFNNVDKYNKSGINKRGILMYGPPGTGKTTVGKIICNNLKNGSIIWLTPEVITENQNRSADAVKALYKLADFMSPCIMIWEDLDLFAQDRESVSSNHLGTLLNVLDGINAIPNMITIGTTNRLETIEGALRNRPGRFDRIIHFSSLNDDLREEMLHKKIKDWETVEPLGELIPYLIKETEGWTGAEIQELINTLILIFIDEEKKVISKDKIDEALKTMRRFGVGEKSSTTFGFNQK